MLHQRAEEVTPTELGSPQFAALIADMVETMYAANGVGIAATQVGVGKRIFIAESAEGPIALVNPVITRRSKKMLKDEEGCLSIPGEFDKVLRHKEIDVEALTPTGEKVAFTARDFFARILQHEIDHLEGLLYVDRVQEQRG